jgi:capsular polysaccharide biosynthesis protein
VNAAQVEREAARAAFKYRYSVVWPPQVAREPVSPNPKKVFAVGGFAAVVLALLAVVGPDLLSGRIFERWQVERGLRLPVLGDMRRIP